MPTIEINVTQYEPGEGESTGAYLARCGDAFVQQHGYDYQMMVNAEGPTHQLQINVPDSAVPGGTRPVKILGAQNIMDVAGDIITEDEFNAKYGQ